MVFIKGKSGFKGKKHSIATKQKLKIAQLNKRKKFGFINSSMTRKKLSLANKGNKNALGTVRSKETKDKISEARKGMKFSEVHKNAIRLSRIGKIGNGKGKSRLKVSGINHWNWQGGLTDLAQIIRHHFKYRQWRSDIFTRDNFTCQKCNKRGGNLEAHHIKEFAFILKEYKIKTLAQALVCEELWDINNGITLCKDCHNLINKV